MRCVSCGSENPEGMKFCGNCGRPLGSATAPEARARNCVGCGRPIGWDANICMYCGYDFQSKVKKGTEGYLLTGAILTMMAGIMGLALLLIIWGSNGLEFIYDNPIYVLSFFCCALGLIGGFAALSGRWFPLAVIGAAASIFSPAFFFGIPGLILIANSATRFKDFVEIP